MPHARNTLFGLRPARRRLLRITGAVGVLFSLPAPAAEIAGYDKPVVISESGYLNSEPDIGPGGLIAWLAHRRPHLDSEEDHASRIFVHYEGGSRAVTGTAEWPNIAHSRPRVQGNSVVWQSLRRSDQPFPEGAVDHVLQDVPETLRDQDHPELPAFFAAREKGDGFNLNPGQQAYLGPFTNLQDWAEAYFGTDLRTNKVAVTTTNPDNPGVAPPAPEAAAPPPSRADRTDNLGISPRTRRGTQEAHEITRWRAEAGVDFTTYDHRADINPSGGDNLIAWQRAKAFPFGWEIMARVGEVFHQITTNYYYDLGPVVDGDTVAWYGWDGHDYEIYTWNAVSRMTTQVTTNNWDDVSPVVGGGLIAWESYRSAEADIYLKSPSNAVPIKISASQEDDLNPVIANGYVFWQSFDGDDFEIWMFDPTRGGIDPVTQMRGQSVQVTNNDYDDVSPSAADGLLTWMAYVDNWDAEILLMDLASGAVKQLTDNDYEDKTPRTARRMVVWQADTGKSRDILLAKPD
jgi:beta propeller repeat protein